MKSIKTNTVREHSEQIRTLLLRAHEQLDIENPTKADVHQLVNRLKTDLSIAGVEMWRAEEA